MAAAEARSAWANEARAFVALGDAWASGGGGAPWAWDWRWVPIDGRHPLSCAVAGYLVLDRHFRPARAAPEARRAAAEDAVRGDDDDDAAAAAVVGPRTIEWEYHVLWSTVYEAPELRLRAAWGDGGAPLSVDAVRDELALPAAAAVAAVPILSAEAHPATGGAFLLVHGCCDGDRAAALGDASLLAWFAALAPSVGLAVPPEKWLALRREAGDSAPTPGPAKDG